MAQTMLTTQKQYIDFLQSIKLRLDSAAMLMTPKMESIRNTFSETAVRGEENISGSSRFLVEAEGK